MPAASKRAPIYLPPNRGRAFPMGPVRAVFKADGAETRGRYSVSEWWLAPHTKGPGTHSHAEDHVFYVIEGTMSILVNGRRINAKQGSFLLAPGGTPHDFENRTTKRAGMLNVSVPGDFEEHMPGIAEWFRARSPEDASTKVKPQRRVEPKQTREEKKVRLLSGGNPQIAKGEGDAPVQAYIAAMPGWKREIGKRLDGLIVRVAPRVRKAVKWNSPFYGIEGQGWFLSFHVFTHYVKVTFFRGQALRPVPPGESKHKDVRYIDIREDDVFDEAQIAAWVKQAAAMPGWVP